MDCFEVISKCRRCAKKKAVATQNPVILRGENTKKPVILQVSAVFFTLYLCSVKRMIFFKAG